MISISLDSDILSVVFRNIVVIEVEVDVAARTVLDSCVL